MIDGNEYQFYGQENLNNEYEFYDKTKKLSSKDHKVYFWILFVTEVISEKMIDFVVKKYKQCKSRSE